MEPPGSIPLLNSPQLASGGVRQHQSGVNANAESALWFAFFVNSVLGSVKLFAWFLSGSPSVFSESLHSFGDSANSIALILGNKFSQKPPDRTHPFGYGLEANVWALAACVFLLVTSGLAIWEGLQHLTHPELNSHAVTKDAFYWSVGILLFSVVLEGVALQKASYAVIEEMKIPAGNSIQAIWLAARHVKHVVRPTTRFIFYEDLIALLGAFLALLSVTLSFYAVEWSILPPALSHWPDAITSVVIGLLLLSMAVYLFRHNRGILTQTAAPARIEKRIEDIVTNLTGVSEVLDLKTVDHGLSGLNVHLQVEVDPYIQVKDVDDLTERIKGKVQDGIAQVRQVFVEVLADESEIEWSQKFYDLIEQGRKAGVLDAREEMLLKNVYDFTEVTVEDIMIPRTDVDYVDVEASLSEVAERMIESGYSRLPVFKETIDDLVGIVHAKDVFEKIYLQTLDIPLSEIVREIEIYPENKPVSDLLEEFKRNKIRIAAVADEHGGFAGLVTVEDMIEEIIGEIWDEHDEEESPMFVVVSPTEVLVKGKCEIEDLNDRLGLSLPFDDFKTVGGFVFGELGREPEEGDLVSFEDLCFKVQEVDAPRIVSVRLTAEKPFHFSETVS
jgi:cation diffusion facilitator family transporter